jgi:hypothetical protein
VSSKATTFAWTHCWWVRKTSPSLPLGCPAAKKTAERTRARAFVNLEPYGVKSAKVSFAENGAANILFNAPDGATAALESWVLTRKNASGYALAKNVHPRPGYPRVKTLVKVSAATPDPANCN